VLMLGVALFVFFFISSCAFLRRAYVLKKSQQYLKEITIEFEKTLETLQQTETQGNKKFGDPGMLATIITVLVNKYGTIRLNIDDFGVIPDDEYVSVYVETNTQELILSLNHTLGEENPLKFVNFKKSDDSTYH
jgi:outer membrane lipoprotein-sorting protein